MRALLQYLAIDLGASSGRGVVGSFNGSRLYLREIHRFANGPMKHKSGLRWDDRRIFGNVKKCLVQATDTRSSLTGVGIDTWGVDYGLLNEFGVLLNHPFHYRDGRTAGLMEEASSLIGRERIYSRTGIAFLPFNTLYQLMADKKQGGLAGAKALVFMPDLLNYWLTGVWQTESTIASTSQFFDSGSGMWATDILESLGLPSGILPAVAKPGSVVGKLLPEIARETDQPNAMVIAPASHDTGSAVVAVPGAETDDWAYISSGTWSLVGRELKSPICSSDALNANFTNEGGLAGTIRFQKNVTGLWLLQSCQRAWAEKGSENSFQFLGEAAADAAEFASFVDPDDASFAEYADMPQRIRGFCERSGQNVPRSVGEIVRCIIESIALKCAVVLEELERLTGKVKSIHLVGGGVNNPMLCQFTANATGRPVLAGPVEATAIGNVMAQALAMGEIASLAEIRTVVRASFATVRYEPQKGDAWDEAMQRFRKVLRAGAGS